MTEHKATENLELWATRVASVQFFEPFFIYLNKINCGGVYAIPIDDGIYEYLIHTEQFEKSIEKVCLKAANKPFFIIDSYSKGKKNILKISRELSVSVKNNKYKKLPKLFDDFAKCMIEFGFFIVFPHYMERVWEPKLKLKYGDIYEHVSSLGQKCDYHFLLNDLYKYENKRNIKKYGYLGYYSLDNGRHHIDNDFLDQLKKQNSPSKIREILSEIGANNNQFELTKKSLINRKDKDEIDLIHEMVYIRTDRVDVIRKSLDILRPFYKYVAKINNPGLFSEDDLFVFTIKEIQTILKKNKNIVSPEEIKKRFTDKNSIYICDKNNKKFITGPDFIEARNFLKIKDSLVTEIKGTVAFKAPSVKGIVFLVKKGSQKRLPENSILVAKHTDPSDLQYMSESIAIITDEGGLTSHAAIVARELKKPCIIGTKIATKVLKDGDLVEVDAEKGVVKIMKKG